MSNWLKILLTAAVLKTLLLEPAAVMTPVALLIAAIGVWVWEAQIKPKLEERRAEEA